MSKRFLQLLSGYADGDAISKEAYILNIAAQKLGMESYMFAPVGRIAPDSTDVCEPLENFHSRSDDIVIFHYAIDSPVTSIYKNANGRKIIRYHNITPHEFFDGFDDSVAESLRNARRELNNVVGDADEIWAVSQYNADELKVSGNQSVEVIPLFFDCKAEKEYQPDPAMTAILGGGLRNILFVGRVAPNKNIEDIIEAFAWIHHNDKHTRLLLAGSARSCPRYYAMLKFWAGRLGLSNILFLDFLNHNQLAACYEAADLFVSTSKHEGFCLPLIEAMNYNVPVIAHETGGMPEALGESGVLYKNLSAPLLAELINRVATDAELRNNILNSQSLRIEQIRTRNIESTVKELLFGSL